MNTILKLPFYCNSYRGTGIGLKAMLDFHIPLQIPDYTEISNEYAAQELDWNL